MCGDPLHPDEPYWIYTLDTTTVASKRWFHREERKCVPHFHSTHIKREGIPLCSTTLIILPQLVAEPLKYVISGQYTFNREAVNS